MNTPIFPEHIQKHPIFYKGYNLSHYLITYHSFEHIEAHIIKDHAKRAIRNLFWPISAFGTFLIGKLNYKRNKFIDSKCKTKYLFVCNWPQEHRAFSILGNIISSIENKNEVLIVTDCEDIYQYYTTLKIACVYICISGLSFDKEIWKKKYLDSHESFILSRVKRYIDAVEKFMDEFQPDITLTVCDLHTFERVFAESARLKGVLSITHQHGQMAPTNRMHDYTISNYIVVWGNKTKENIEDYIKLTEIKVLGTDIHGNLLEQKAQIKKDSITLALNPRSDEINKFLITQIIMEMNKLGKENQNTYSFILKLHPSMKQKFWEKFFVSSAKSLSFKMQYEIATYGNEVILNRSKILLVLSSSIALEAFICGASVITLDIPQLYNNPLVFYDKLPESIVGVNDLLSEVDKRLNDAEYNMKILDKQELSIKEHIFSFDSSNKELEWIEELLS